MAARCGRLLAVVTAISIHSITQAQVAATSTNGVAHGLQFQINPGAAVRTGSINNSSVSLNWILQTNVVYQVQVSSNLVSWQAIGAAFTNSGAARMWVENATNLTTTAWPQRYYRLQPPTNSAVATLAAKFTASSSQGTAPLTVQFTDQSTGSPVSWNWNFGDGTTSTLQNPSHLFSTPTNYTVILTVQNSAGASSSKSTVIQVNPLVLGATLPSQVLNLSNWKLTLPTGAAGSPTEIDQPALNTFTDPNYFHVDAAGDGVVFTANCGGVTTSGSGYPRSELREMVNNGTAQASWSTTSGISTMEVTEAILHLPVVKNQAIAGQIHDGVTKVIDCRLDGSTLFMENASGGTVVVLDNNYQLGTKFTFKWVVQNGGIAIYYNGQYITTYSVTDSGCYFKVGDYTQSNTSKGDAATAYGQVVVYSATVSHQ